MLSEKINSGLNAQMNKEFHSAYTYLAASSYFEEEELTGFANFFKIQSQEELQHAMKFYDYIHQAGGHVQLEAVAAPHQVFDSPLGVFEFGLKQERELADSINKLWDLAIAENHAPSRVFMQWFVTEQVEEESLFLHCIKRIKMAGSEGYGLVILDQEFAKRSLGAED